MILHPRQPDPRLHTTRSAVLSDATVCLADPAITNGSFQICGEIETLLDAVQEADTTGVAPEVPLKCSEDCQSNFAALSEACSSALQNGILNSDNQYIASYGQQFFDAQNGFNGCESTGPAPAVVAPAPAPVEVPAPSPVEVPAPAPAPVVVTPPPMVAPPPALPPAAGATGGSYVAGSMVIGAVLAML